jgi:hypothetical protein
MGMVTPETIDILVNLLDGWQRVLLREDQRAVFLDWLGRHTNMDIRAENLREGLSDWLSGMDDPKRFYLDVLIIHSEILWSSKLDEQISQSYFVNRRIKT